MIKKDTRERLFEIMGKIDPTFKPVLNETVVSSKNIIIESYVYEANVMDFEDNDEVQGEPRQDAGLPEPETEINVEAPLTQEKNSITDVNFKVTITTNDEKYADKEIQKLYKMAAKFGLPQPIVTKGKPYRKPITFATGERYSVDVMDITVNATGMFKFPGGYRLVAIVDNAVDVAYIIDSKELSTIPKEYLKPCSSCDHCGTNRNRDKTFVVIDDKGEYVRLGSSCVKKFLGLNPLKYLSALSYTKLFQDNFGKDFDEGGGGGWGKERFSPKLKIIETAKAISLIEEIIKRDGYEKRLWEEPTESRWGGYEKPRRSNFGDATADKVENIMLTKEEWEKVPINKEFVDKFLKFADSLEQKPDQKPGFNEFLGKVKELASMPEIRVFEAAFLAAAINFYHEQAKREEKYAGQRQSVFLGTVGEKIKIPYAKLTEMRYGEGAYGMWYLWTFEDENGNILKKFGELSEKFLITPAPEGAKELGRFHEGDVFKFTTDVKKHEEFRGIKTTQIGRLSKF